VVLLQEVYPGPCSGLSGRSLVIVASSSVRPEECSHFCTSFCNLVYLFWPASSPPSLNVLSWWLSLYQRSLVDVFEVFHLEGEEGEFCYSFHPLLRFPL
jgi:hypothetical protein